MICQRCNSGACTTKGRFAGKLCGRCVLVLHNQAQTSRRVRRNPRNGSWHGPGHGPERQRYTTSGKIPIRTA